jgi:hypothetical protein
MYCIGEAAATTCNYDDNQEEKESEQNSGPQRNDYTTHSLRMEILIAMTAAMLLTIMIDRTVRRLIRPTNEPNARNDGTERRTNNPSQRSECETEVPNYNDKAACELALYGTTNQPVFRRLHIPRCSTHRGCLRHDEDHLMTGSIQMILEGRASELLRAVFSRFGRFLVFWKGLVENFFTCSRDILFLDPKSVFRHGMENRA